MVLSISGFERLNSNEETFSVYNRFPAAFAPWALISNFVLTLDDIFCSLPMTSISCSLSRRLS